MKIPALSIWEASSQHVFEGDNRASRIAANRKKAELKQQKQKHTGPSRGAAEAGEAALGPPPFLEVPPHPGTHLPAAQCLKVAPQLLHCDRDVLQLRSTYRLLLEHICPPAV
ncbi:hypothetical protein EK904_012212 [Melospiza melodia maxima]|nr:hypothetical protein EK904_012212 [Melospiza melodia maxima]